MARDKKYGEYLNMKLELRREGVTQEQVAEHLDMTLSNLNYKLNGTVPFTVAEVVAIRDKFAPDATLDYLLTTN
jgi:hypothetical protein